MPTPLRLLLASLSLLLALPLTAQPVQEQHSEVRLSLSAADDPGSSPGQVLVARLAAHGVHLDHARVEPTASGRALRAVLSASELAATRAAGVAVEVLTDDLAAEVTARLPLTEAERQAALRAAGIEGNIFGSMGGYPTFTEALAILDEMQAQFPELITARASLGQSHEGRDVWMVELSDNPGVDEGEPEALITSLHHAREPAGLTTVLYTLWYLLENYGTDPEVTYLLDTRRLFVVPVLNPDGYVYNEATNPNGGGYWRKNRRDNGGSVYGVDLNRNYGYQWGYDDSGSSPQPSSDTYRGPAPFSEPETQAIRDFLEGGRQVRTAFNYHTYSNLLLWPWGYVPDLPPDAPTFDRYGQAMTAVNGYTQGPGYTTIYPTNGDADDWMYGEQATKPLVFAFTPEVGSDFWPPASEIVPLAEENLEANLLLLGFAGPYVEATAVTAADDGGNGYLDPGEAGTLTLTLANSGQTMAEGVRARVVSTTNALVVSGAFGDPFTLAPGEEAEVGPFAVEATAEAPVGLVDGLALELDFDGAVVTRPLPPVALGTPVDVLADDASTTDGWSTGAGWGLSAEHVSPPTAFADSPSGDYPPNANNALTLLDPVDLTGAEAAVLQFQTRWDVESGWDFAQVLASADGAAWTPLEGRYTQPGSGSGQQPNGQPGYDGTRTEWVEETMDLGAYLGGPLHLRFRLRADGNTQGDGWYVDDVAVRTYVDGATVGVEGSGAPAAFSLEAAYPNPAFSSVTLAFTLPAPSHARLAVYDVLGREVALLADREMEVGRHEAVLDGSRLPAGVYVVRLEAGGTVQARRLTLLR